MIEIDDMRSFVAVVEAGGLSKAAARLGISKSVVSRRVSAMERALGTRLVGRTSRGIEPTEAGIDFAARATRIIADYDDALAVAACHGGEVIGRLRISLPVGFGERHVAPLIAELARRHPRLEFDVSFSDRLVDVVGERFDAAVRVGALKDSTLVARRLAPVRSVLVASPDYLSRHGRPAEPADLSHHSFLMLASRVGADLRLRSGQSWTSVRVGGRIRSDSGEALLGWAIAGLGVAEAPSFLVSDAIYAGKLEPILPAYEGPEYAIWVIRPPGNPAPAKVRVLIDILVERFGGVPDWDGCLAIPRQEEETIESV